MSSVRPGTQLLREDVIGRSLLQILQTGSINEDGLDFVYTFCRLDSGATFCLPFDDAGSFLVEKPPPDCGVLEHPEIEPVLGSRIVNVLRQGPDADFVHDSPYLVMENGYVVTDVMGDYHGTGYAGLHVYPPGEIDIAAMREFFT